MKAEQFKWNGKDWTHTGDALPDADLVLYFGGQGLLDSGERYRELRGRYPDAHILGCSTGGEIHNAEVLDNTVVGAAVKLEKTAVKVASAPVDDMAGSRAAGRRIADALKGEGLCGIFILSDGTRVNGSDLLEGMYSVLDKSVTVTGGLAGDGADFGRTLVALDDVTSDRQVAAVGFYGDAFSVSYGSAGGWDTFGPQRRITRARGNVLFELDDKPALDLYKTYLGDDAARLPGSALLFPLKISPQDDAQRSVVRTIVGVDEESNSLIFAGDVPEGYTAQLMNGNFSHLVDGAAHAAEQAARMAEGSRNGLAVLVSCIGRKLLLGQSTPDETEATAAAIGKRVPCIGFYSYGEICPKESTGECVLHNQTMTVSLFHER